jgi:hypothetical protein
MTPQSHPAGVDFPGIRALSDPSCPELRRKAMMQVMALSVGRPVVRPRHA